MANKKYKVGIIGATGMVGQRFAVLLKNHPWFEVAALAASPRSAGKPYREAVKKWLIAGESIDDLPFADMVVQDASADKEKIARAVDFVFCAVDMPKADIKALEEAYAKLECPVMSNNSAHRGTPDVPMIIPEINAGHAEVITAQRTRLGTTRGFISVKSNCSIQSYVPMLTPLLPFGIKAAAICTYQAISGAGKTFETWEEMVDNVIPYIGGEEEKSEQEPLKVWGKVTDGKIIPASAPYITTQCIRVPVSDGHTAAVFVKFEKTAPALSEIKQLWQNFSGEPQRRNLPSAPKQFIYYFEEDNCPQARLHRGLENGMAVSAGRLRAETAGLFDIKFVGLSHNTLRGAAGGAVLMAELLCDMGLI